MTRILAFTLGGLMAANGVYMFIDPPGWYAAVPGVPDTGPLNEHFVRDIGLAYLVAGLAFIWSEWGGGWRVTLAGALFIALHSALHVGETLLGHHHDVIANEIIAVHAPALLALWLALIQSRKQA